jgi:choline dehydrogenase-like flavoprotein
VSWHHDIVSALAYSFGAAHGEPTKFCCTCDQVLREANPPAAPGPEAGRSDLRAPYNDLTRFIVQQQAQMPDYLRAAMRAATLGFDLVGLFRAGRLFHSQPPTRRWRQVRAWKHSRVGFKRDLMRYYESLGTLALYSRLAEGAQRQPALLLRPGSEEEEGADKNTGEAPVPRVGGGDTGGAAAPQRIVCQPEHELRCEIAVVGSGPGGAITACLLAEAGRDVLLVEQGAWHPPDSCAPFSLDEMREKYRNGGQTVALGRNKVAYAEACCVGGGSEINSGLYHRTPPEMLAAWRQEFQVEALDETALRPHFEAIERELSVSFLPGAAPAASLKLEQGATRLGWRSLEVPRWFRYDGASAAGGARQTMSRTFVRRFLDGGGQLLPGTRIERLRREGGQWRLDGTHVQAGALRIAAQTVFLCGGAVQSPALLRRSGITRHVGNSLQVHPTVKVLARFEEPVNSAEMGVPVHQVKEFAPRLSFGCSISTPPYLALGLLDHPAAAREVSRSWAQMANYYAMIVPEGRGTVRTLPGFRDPVVRYRLTPTDLRNLAEGFRRLAEMLLAAGASALYPGLAGSAPLRSAADVARLPEALPAGRASLMTVHLFSSCPMGEDRARCAADSFGRLHDHENLFLNDASLLCTSPGVNPQGSIMALARRNALHFLNRD